MHITDELCDRQCPMSLFTLVVVLLQFGTSELKCNRATSVLARDFRRVKAAGDNRNRKKSILNLEFIDVGQFKP